MAQVARHLELPFESCESKSPDCPNWITFCSMLKVVPLDLLINNLTLNSLYVLKDDILRVPKSGFVAL